MKDDSDCSRPLPSALSATGHPGRRRAATVFLASDVVVVLRLDDLVTDLESPFAVLNVFFSTSPRNFK
jgi:hypothetical protein